MLKNIYKAFAVVEFILRAVGRGVLFNSQFTIRNSQLVRLMGFPLAIVRFAHNLAGMIIKFAIDNPKFAIG
jgi:hypothetical protein